MSGRVGLDGPEEVEAFVTAGVLARLTGVVPRSWRRMAHRHRGWVLVILAVAALALMVVGSARPPQ